MDKQAPGALPQDRFDIEVKNSDPKIAINLLLDRQSRQSIVNGDYFDGLRFEKICNFDRIEVYKKMR
jgi:hypothetical protein